MQYTKNGAVSKFLNKTTKQWISGYHFAVSNTCFLDAIPLLYVTICACSLCAGEVGEPSRFNLDVTSAVLLLIWLLNPSPPPPRRSEYIEREPCFSVVLFGSNLLSSIPAMVLSWSFCSLCST